VHGTQARPLGDAPEGSFQRTDRGNHAYTPSGFRAVFFRLFRQLEAERKVNHGLTFHGLRTTLATAIADADGDTRTIAAALSQATEAMAAHYARGADRRRRASQAIALLEQKKEDG
jgi:integrase